MDNFDYNNVISDICNADQKLDYPFDDRISLRVYNHFSDEGAKEEYDRKVGEFSDEIGFRFLDNVGDEAFGIIKIENGFLDRAFIEVIKDQFSLYMEVNGATFNTANNCLDENSAIDLARELMRPL